MLEGLDALLALAGVGMALGWVTFGDEKPPPVLTEATPWKESAIKVPISMFSVSESGMWEIVTSNSMDILFFENSDSRSLNWDIGEENDIPRVSYKTRLVPPRKSETEMTIHARSREQLEELRNSPRAVNRHVLSNFDALEHI